jgi:hypothetical protein
MSETLMEKALMWYMEYVIALPLTLSMSSNNPALRVLGAFGMLPWFVLLSILGPLTLGTMLLLLILMLFETAWRG